MSSFQASYDSFASWRQLFLMFGDHRYDYDLFKHQFIELLDQIILNNSLIHGWEEQTAEFVDEVIPLLIQSVISSQPSKAIIDFFSSILEPLSKVLKFAFQNQYGKFILAIRKLIDPQIPIFQNQNDVFTNFLNIFNSQMIYTIMHERMEAEQDQPFPIEIFDLFFAKNYYDFDEGTSIEIAWNFSQIFGDNLDMSIVNKQDIISIQSFLSTAKAFFCFYPDFIEDLSVLLTYAAKLLCSKSLEKQTIGLSTINEILTNHIDEAGVLEWINTTELIDDITSIDIHQDLIKDMTPIFDVLLNNDKIIKLLLYAGKIHRVQRASLFKALARQIGKIKDSDQALEILDRVTSIPKILEFLGEVAIEFEKVGNQEYALLCVDNVLNLKDINIDNEQSAILALRKYLTNVDFPVSHIHVITNLLQQIIDTENFPNESMLLFIRDAFYSFTDIIAKNPVNYYELSPKIFTIMDQAVKLSIMLIPNRINDVLLSFINRLIGFRMTLTNGKLMHIDLLYQLYILSDDESVASEAKSIIVDYLIRSQIGDETNTKELVGLVNNTLHQKPERKTRAIEVLYQFIDSMESFFEIEDFLFHGKTLSRHQMSNKKLKNFSQVQIRVKNETKIMNVNLQTNVHYLQYRISNRFNINYQSIILYYNDAPLENMNKFLYEIIQIDNPNPIVVSINQTTNQNNHFPTIMIPSFILYEGLFPDVLLIEIEESDKDELYKKACWKLLKLLPTSHTQISNLQNIQKFMDCLNNSPDDYVFCYRLQILLRNNKAMNSMKPFINNDFASLLIKRLNWKHSVCYIFELIHLMFPDSIINQYENIFFPCINNIFTSHDKKAYNSASLLFNRIITSKESRLVNITNFYKLFNKIVESANSESWSWIESMMQAIPRPDETCQCVFNHLVNTELPNLYYSKYFKKIIQDIPDGRKQEISDKMVEIFGKYDQEIQDNLLDIIYSLNRYRKEYVSILLPYAFTNFNQKKIYEICSTISDGNQDMNKILCKAFDQYYDVWSYDPSSYSLRPPYIPGLRNLGSTCYINSFIYMMFFIRPISYHMFTSTFQKESYQNLQMIFAQLQLGKISKIDTAPFVRKWDKCELLFPINEQHDANEFISEFINEMPEEILKYFLGKYRHTFSGIDFDYVSIKNEDFITFDVTIDRFDSLEASLAQSFLDVEKLIGSNQYKVESIGKIDATKSTLIQECPTILMFHLKRFYFDRSDGTRKKIDGKFSFPQHINMKPYLFDKSKDANYTLFGVINHRGNASHGHYYSVIKYQNQWYAFNDTDIYRVDTFEKETFGGEPMGDPNDLSIPGCAYILLYIKDDAIFNIDGKVYGFNENFDISRFIDPKLSETVKQMNDEFMLKQSAFSSITCNFVVNFQQFDILLPYFLNIYLHSLFTNPEQIEVFLTIMRNNIISTGRSEDAIKYFIERYDSNVFPILKSAQVPKLLLDALRVLLLDFIKYTDIEISYQFIGKIVKSLDRLINNWAKNENFITSIINQFFNQDPIAIVLAIDGGWFETIFAFALNVIQTKPNSANLHDTFLILSKIISSSSQGDFAQFINCIEIVPSIRDKAFFEFLKSAAKQCKVDNELYQNLYISHYKKPDIEFQNELMLQQIIFISDIDEFVVNVNAQKSLDWDQLFSHVKNQSFDKVFKRFLFFIKSLNLVTNEPFLLSLLNAFVDFLVLPSFDENKDLYIQQIKQEFDNLCLSDSNISTIIKFYSIFVSLLGITSQEAFSYVLLLFDQALRFNSTDDSLIIISLIIAFPNELICDHVLHVYQQLFSNQAKIDEKLYILNEILDVLTEEQQKEIILQPTFPKLLSMIFGNNAQPFHYLLLDKAKRFIKSNFEIMGTSSMIQYIFNSFVSSALPQIHRLARDYENTILSKFNELKPKDFIKMEESINNVMIDYMIMADDNEEDLDFIIKICCKDKKFHKKLFDSYCKHMDQLKENKDALLRSYLLITRIIILPDVNVAEKIKLGIMVAEFQNLFKDENELLFKELNELRKINNTNWDFQVTTYTFPTIYLQTNPDEQSMFMFYEESIKRLPEGFFINTNGIASKLCNGWPAEFDPSDSILKNQIIKFAIILKNRKELKEKLMPMFKYDEKALSSAGLETYVEYIFNPK